MWITQLYYVPEKTRFVATLVVLALTAIFPVLFIYTLMRAGKVKDLDISDRRERMLPLIMTLVCYALAAGYMYIVHAPWWLVMYFVSGCVTVIVAFVISLYWKISVHGAGMGNMIGFLTALAVNDVTTVNIMPWICGLIILTGMVGSARIILSKHTLWQVYCGIVLSAVITYFGMTLHAASVMYN